MGDAGFAYPSMNPLPILQIVLLVICAVLLACCGLALFRCKRCVPFRAAEGGSERIVPVRPVETADQVTSSLQNIQAMAAAAGNRKGNSAASRLVGPTSRAI